VKITSTSFTDGGRIPVECTCDGAGINPQLSFENVPEGAQSLVLIVHDPDVPKNLVPSGIFDHWVVFNIPPGTTGVDASSTLSGVYGSNSAGKPAYTGPCPPDREHRYIFDLYALDQMLDLKQGATKGDVLGAMQGHILMRAEMIGRFNRAANMTGKG
jgi:Raf kinase inhibitor-like YbhB/YbcL family protein